MQSVCAMLCFIVELKNMTNAMLHPTASRFIMNALENVRVCLIQMHIQVQMPNAFSVWTVMECSALRNLCAILINIWKIQHAIGGLILQTGGFIFYWHVIKAMLISWKNCLSTSNPNLTIAANLSER